MFTELLQPEYGIVGFILVIFSTLIWKLVSTHSQTIQEVRKQDIESHREKGEMMTAYIKTRDEQFQTLLTNHLAHTQEESIKLRDSHERLVRAIEKLTDRL